MLTKTPVQSSAFDALKIAASIGNNFHDSIYFSVQCTEAEAAELLEVAKEHCPNAVPRITEAIKNGKH